MGKERANGLTPRQREWLRHLRKASRAGGTVRAYARHHGLSEHALYQAAKELRRKGALPPAGRPSRGRTAERGSAAARPRFVELRATRPTAAETTGAWRARMPNGVVVEGAGELGGVLEALHRL